MARLKDEKRRKLSSRTWLERQISDPYVARAKREGLRSRAAYKLVEIDDKYHDAQGWRACRRSRRRARRLERNRRAPRPRQKGRGRVIAIDLLDMTPIPGVEFLKLDFLDATAPERLKTMLDGKAQGKADVVLSDMAANATGHRQTDHLRIMALAEAAAVFARDVLAAGGTFLCKVLQGGTEAALLAELKRDFSSVKHVKPPASRIRFSGALSVGAGISRLNEIGYRAGSPPRHPAVFRPESSAPASGAKPKKIIAALAAIAATTRNAGGKSFTPIAAECFSRSVISTTSAPTATPVDKRQLLSGSHHCGGAAHLRRLDLGIGEGIDAGELQRAEEAAGQQDGDHGRIGHAVHEGGAGGEKGAADKRIVQAARCGSRKRLSTLATAAFMNIEPSAVVKVMRPDWNGVRSNPICNNSGNRNGSAPMPRRNKNPPKILARKVGSLSRVRSRIGAGVCLAWAT